MGEDELLIDFDFVGDDFAQFEDLEERLAAMIGQAGVGKYEGNEFATDGSNGSLAMYGPDADALYAVARTLLAEATFLGNVRFKLHYRAPKDGVQWREKTLDTRD